MASVASNATSTCTWPTRLCSCGSGPCIPTIASPRAKNHDCHYYRCPHNPVRLSTEQVCLLKKTSCLIGM
ncbi:hypothetical protein RHGRI_007063 [Rhododendron griersonianum]|uniref:Uncharacterized protein n=1 Tax=Rhododendron griersonianum TaxID=479676 RepID=A0AAV6KVH2_9ERIC|nr:hypothetical protein RHGRI_007063 [Rhododendron griersonianum]